MLQPTEMYLVLTSLMMLPAMIVLSWLALTGAFDAIEAVKYIVVVPDEGEVETVEAKQTGSRRSERKVAVTK